MAYSEKTRDVFAGEIVTIKDKGLFKEKRFICSPQDAEITVEYPEGSSHTGKVVRLAPFGAFVTLEPGIDGLVHISELGKGKRINHPREVLEENQTIEVKISRVDEEEKRLSLAMVSNEQD